MQSEPTQQFEIKRECTVQFRANSVGISTHSNRLVESCKKVNGR